MDRIEIDRGETIILNIRKHWIIFLRDAVSTLVVGIVPFVFVALVSMLGVIPSPIELSARWISFAAALWLLIVWMALFVLWTDYYLDMWIITDRRIINMDQVGLFKRHVATIDMHHIQEVTTKTENPLQAFFGYGTLELQTAGPTNEYAKVEGIPDPERARIVILQHAEQYSKLEETNQKQETLLHSISHEVKGYLTKDEAALASIVEERPGTVSTSVHNMAQSALSETRRGVDTVMGILDTSNFKSGTMQLEKKRFDMKTIIADIVRDIKPSAQAKGLSFQTVIDEGAFSLEGDEAKLRRHVFRNLIDNAVRYTKSGGVEVLLSKSGKSGNNIVFSVKDTGVGITPEDMPILFTEGGKGKHAQEVNAESTGYGLFVARMIVEAHGGKIWAESKGTDTGAQFFVELPTAP